MHKPSSSIINASASPWHVAERTGLTVCHHCGHPYELGWNVSTQHYQGCPWLEAYLKESQAVAVGDGPTILNE
jgi:hypothetical protein